MTSHPLAVLAMAIILEQAGMPIASAPMLLLIGALTGNEKASIPLAILVAVVACVFVDCAWFALGRSRKSNPSRAFKRLQSADSRFFRIARLFARHGAVALLLARFIPGPNLAAALAGYSGRSKSRFVLKDTIASGIWAIIYLAVGHFLPRELRSWVSSTMNSSLGCGVFLILGIAAAILGFSRFGRYLSRRRASRLGVPASTASGAIRSDTYLNPEVVQTVRVQ
ncbi:MAG: DedA family protein [Terracidiphilus sp.]